MLPDQRRYEQAKEILQRVLELTPGARAAYLQTACADDAALRADVESLLSAHDDVNSSFLDGPLAPQADDVEAKPEDVDLNGKRVGAYRLERLLGRGGMGAVYLGSRVDGEFSKHVAVKFIRTSRVSPAALKRFKAERQILADIDHPNIARLIDGGTAEGMPFFIMEYVPGDTLAQAIERGPLPVDRATKMATGVAEVLEAIHAKGMVFRDLKPSNIILSEDTGVKVLDFGIAKLMQADTGEETTRSTLTGAGFVVGSPRYMSPEQAAGESVDARSDVFSYGIVMFEALTGRLPFSGASRKEYFRSLVAAEPAPLPASVPSRFRAIVERCLKKEPDQRFKSGRELADAVRAMTSANRFLGDPATKVALVSLAVLAATGFWIASQRADDSSPLLKVPSTVVRTWASSETHPRFSPDSTWVSFKSDRDGKERIWLTNRVSREERSIEPLGRQLLGHEWSPTNDRIAYLTRAGSTVDLVIVPVSGTDTPVVHKLPYADVTLVRWRTKGIYYLAGFSLRRFDLENGRETELSKGRGKVDLIEADVSADERHVVFTARKDGISRLWTSGLDVTAPVSVTEDRINPRYVRWRGARAREAVFVSEEGDSVDIWQVDVSSHKRRRVTSSEVREGRFDVSTDATELVYTQVKEESHLGTFTPGDGKSIPTRVTSDSLSDIAPSASASGRSVAFQRSRAILTIGGLRHATVRVNEDGFRSDPRLIESGFAPEISPDGRWIAYLEAKAEPYGPLWMTDLQQPGAKPWKVSDQFKRPSYTVFPQNFVESVHFWSSHKPRLYFRARGASGADNVWQVDPVLDGPPLPAEQVTDITDPSAEIWDFRLSRDGRRLSYLLKSKAKNVVDLYVRDLARNKESVEWSEPAGSALACPGWLADDSIVVLRVQRGDMSATDVLLVKAGKAVEVGRLRDVTQGSAALDSRQRILYLTRDVGVVHSLLALRLGAGERRGEEVLHTSEPHGAAIVGIRVLGNGQLLFALQTSNDDILSSAFVK